MRSHKKTFAPWKESYDKLRQCIKNHVATRSNQMWNNEFNKIKKNFNPYLFSVLELLDYSTDCFFIVILNYMKSLSIE